MVERQPYPGMPRWVKAFGIVAGVLIVLLAVIVSTGHGPGRHLPSSDGGPDAVHQNHRQ